LAIISADICLSVVNSQLYTIRACSFQQYSSAGIIAQNPVAPDGGDFSIDDNVFSTSSVTASFAIILRGVGGARIINNKIFASNGGIILQQPNATNSSLLMITGNSIEAMAGANPYGIVMQRLGTTGQFVNVTIIGNEFGITSGLSSCRAVYIPSDANGLWVSCLNISNNLMTCSMNSGSFNAMDIDSTSTFSITGNVGFFSGTALASMTMVVARAAADRAVVGPNIHSAGSGASTISSTNTTTITPT
jgi:hypothetical protein